MRVLEHANISKLLQLEVCVFQTACRDLDGIFIACLKSHTACTYRSYRGMWAASGTSSTGRHGPAQSLSSGRQAHRGPALGHRGWRGRVVV